MHMSAQYHPFVVFFLAGKHRSVSFHGLMLQDGTITSPLLLLQRHILNSLYSLTSKENNSHFWKPPLEAVLDTPLTQTSNPYSWSLRSRSHALLGGVRCSLGVSFRHNFWLPLNIPSENSRTLAKKTRQIPSFKNNQYGGFHRDGILNSDLVTNPKGNATVTELVEQYDTIFRTLLDLHARLITNTIYPKPPNPCMD